MGGASSGYGYSRLGLWGGDSLMNTTNILAYKKIPSFFHVSETPPPHGTKSATDWTVLFNQGGLALGVKQ